jgi:hypothetical protein
MSARVSSRRRADSKKTSVAGTAASGQEAGEEEAVARQAGKDERGERRRGAGQRRDRQPFLDRGPHQLEARVRDERRPGVGDERDPAALAEPVEQHRADAVGIVIMIGEARRRDAMDRQKLAGDPRVLAGDEVGTAQHVERAQGDVGGIPDRRRDDVEAGLQPLPCLISARLVRFT